MCHWTQPAARLRIQGEDAAAFLQGQFSNDLRRPEPCPATYGLWLNHKGRVLADSHVLQRAPSVFEVVSRSSPASLIRERLEAYIIADDVAVDDVTAGCAAAIVAGPGTTALVRKLGASGAGPREYAEVGGALVIPARCALGEAFLVLCSPEQSTTWRESLRQSGVREIGASELEWHRVAAGVCRVPDELGPDDLPMEGGLEHDAISFTKGCYLGQEVMARLHNLGQVRRRLFVVRLDGCESGTTKGVALYLGDQKVGELRAAWPAPRAGIEPALGLAMVQVHAVRPGAILAPEPGGAPCVHVERLAEGRQA